jgi:hypothetical protein
MVYIGTNALSGSGRRRPTARAAATVRGHSGIFPKSYAKDVRKPVREAHCPETQPVVRLSDRL